MSTIKVLVHEQSLRVIDGPKIASNGVNENTVEFVFDDSWNGFGKTAIFYKEFHESNVYQSIVNSNGVASVPHEVTDVQCKMCFGVVGTKDNIIYTSEIVKYNIVKGVPISGSESEPPSPTIYQQMLALVGQMQQEFETAQTNINMLVSQMDEFVSDHAGVYGETLIYDADVTGVYLFGKGQDVEPLNDISIRQSNFDFLDIYYIFDGAGYVFTKDYRNYNTEQIHVHAIKTTSSGISFAQIGLDLSGKHIQVRSASRTDFVSGSGPTITNVNDDYVAQTPSDYPAGYVKKIIGRKLVGDAELVDARVGVDGTTYQTVGEAIRSQIDDVAGGTVELDTTLTQQGKAAESKSVGDALALKADKSTTYTKTEVDNAIGLASVVVDSELNELSTNAIQNGVVAEEIGQLKADLGDIRTPSGINLFNPDALIENTFLNGTTGLPETNSNYWATDFIPVDGTYTVRAFEYSGTARTRVYMYDSSKSYDHRAVQPPESFPNGYTFSWTGYIRINIDNGNNNAYENPKKYMLVKGSSTNGVANSFISYYTAHDKTARSDIENLSAEDARLNYALGISHKVIDGYYINSSGVITAGDEYEVHAYKITPASIINSIEVSSLSNKVTYAFYASEPSAGSTSYNGAVHGTALGTLSIENLQVPSGISWVCVRTVSGDTPAVNFVNSKDIQDIVEGIHLTSSIAMFTKVGCVGDSFTAGTIFENATDRAIYPQSSYPAVMGRLYGIEVANFGASGATTTAYLTREDGLPKLIAEDPQQLYLINLGLNDKTQGVPVGTVEDIKSDYTQNPTTYCGNMGRIIDQIKAHAPSAKIILIKSFWTVNIPSYTPQQYYTYNSAAIEAIAEHYGIPYIETLNNVFFRSSKYIPNWIGYHPTAPLYAAMGKEIGLMVGHCIMDNIDYFNDFKINVDASEAII